MARATVPSMSAKRDEYYLLLEGETSGPHTLEELHQMWLDERITLETLFVQPGMKGCRPVNLILNQVDQGLFYLRLCLFNFGTTRAWQAHTILRTTLKVLLKLAFPSTNGSFRKTGNLRHLDGASVTHSQSL